MIKTRRSVTVFIGSQQEHENQLSWAKCPYYCFEGVEQGQYSHYCRNAQCDWSISKERIED